MYIIENEFVYQVEKTEHFEIKSGIGKEKKLELVSETDTEKTYECQKFDLTKEKYVIDDENSETVETEGKEYKADKGKIIIKKQPDETQKKLIEVEMALTEVFEENQNLKKQISEQDVALAELYESMLKNA